MKKINLAIIFFLIALSNSSAQILSPSAGAYLGVGSIKGNSTAQTSFAANVFFDFKVPFITDASFRVNYLHSRKVEYLLPENRQGKYYPFIHALSLKAFINQSLGKLLYVEEGAGIVAVNDRTFSDTNVWDYGVAFNLLGGIDLRALDSGFKLGLGTEYGITFNNTTASYFSFHLQSQYYF